MQEAFRRRYSLEGVPPGMPPMDTPAPVPAEASAVAEPAPAPPPGAAEEAFRRRYGLEGRPGMPPMGAPVAEPAPPPSPSSPPAPLTRPEAAAEVLRLLEQYSPVLEELRSASRRPYARFNIHYDEAYILLLHLEVLRNASLIFHLRASAGLALGRADQAWADAKMVLYLADTIRDEPFPISKVAQATLVQLGLQPIWEGLAEHKWSDAQLVEIEQRLAKLDLLSGAALRGARALNLLNVDLARHPGADELAGFYYHNKLFLARMYEQHFTPVVDAANQRLYPSRGFANESALTNALAGSFVPYRFFARELLPGHVSAQVASGFGQTRVNEAIVACALERYRVAQGQYPESLEALTARFLQKMPHDIITGAPLQYRRTADGRFILYSVGWNEKDEGGQVVPPRDEWTAPELTEGDWVWQYPAPADPGRSGGSAERR